MNIAKLYFQPGTTYEAKSGVTPPGTRFLSMFEEAFTSLTGLPAINSCCYKGSLPTNGQVLTYNSTSKTFVFTTINGGGLGTNLSGTPNATTISLSSSTGTGYVIPSATTSLAGLLSAADKSFFNTLTTNVGSNYYFGTNASGTKGYFSLPSVGSGGNSKYSITVANSDVTARVYGTSGITLVKTNSSTYTFTIPSGGYLENADVFFPSTENPGASVNFVYNYISNTVTNQSVMTADVPDYSAFFSSTTPLDVYYSSSVASTNTLRVQIISAGGGSLTMNVTLSSPGLSSGDIVIKTKF